jgi:hypothetical protein
MVLFLSPVRSVRLVLPMEHLFLLLFDYLWVCLMFGNPNGFPWTDIMLIALCTPVMMSSRRHIVQMGLPQMMDLLSLSSCEEVWRALIYDTVT